MPLLKIGTRTSSRVKSFTGRQGNTVHVSHVKPTRVPRRKNNIVHFQPIGRGPVDMFPDFLVFFVIFHSFDLVNFFFFYRLSQCYARNKTKYINTNKRRIQRPRASENTLGICVSFSLVRANRERKKKIRIHSAALSRSFSKKYSKRLWREINRLVFVFS